MIGRISKLVLTTAGIAALAAALAPAVAQANPPLKQQAKLGWRFRNQQARINQGVQSGQLTRREYNRDESRLQYDRALDLRERQKDHGNLTPAQKLNMERRLNQNSRNIYFTKHNRAHQPGA